MLGAAATFAALQGSAIVEMKTTSHHPSTTTIAASTSIIVAITIEPIASTKFCNLATRAVDGQLAFDVESQVVELTGFPGLTDRQRSFVIAAARDATAQVSSGGGWSNDKLVEAVNQVCGLHLTPATL